MGNTVSNSSDGDTDARASRRKPNKAIRDARNQHHATRLLIKKLKEVQQEKIALQRANAGLEQKVLELEQQITTMKNEHDETNKSRNAQLAETAQGLAKQQVEDEEVAIEKESLNKEIAALTSKVGILESQLSILSKSGTELQKEIGPLYERGRRDMEELKRMDRGISNFCIELVGGDIQTWGPKEASLMEEWKWRVMWRKLAEHDSWIRVPTRDSNKEPPRRSYVSKWLITQTECSFFWPGFPKACLHLFWCFATGNVAANTLLAASHIRNFLVYELENRTIPLEALREVVEVALDYYCRTPVKDRPCEQDDLVGLQIWQIARMLEVHVGQRMPDPVYKQLTDLRMAADNILHKRVSDFCNCLTNLMELVKPDTKSFNDNAELTPRRIFDITALEPQDYRISADGKQIVFTGLGGGYLTIFDLNDWTIQAVHETDMKITMSWGGVEGEDDEDDEDGDKMDTTADDEEHAKGDDEGGGTVRYLSSVDAYNRKEFKEIKIRSDHVGWWRGIEGMPSPVRGEPDVMYQKYDID